MLLEAEGKSASVASPDAGLPETENPSAKAYDNAGTCPAYGNTPIEWKVATLSADRTQGCSDTNRLETKRPRLRLKVVVRVPEKPRVAE